MITVIRNENRLEIRSPMPIGKRILFGLIALFPLIAPYQLLIRIDWQAYFNFFFIFSALISIGALFVSGFLAWAAIAGLSSVLRFDRGKGILEYQIQSPVTGLRTQSRFLTELESLEVDTHDWSDGAPSYSILARVVGGETFKTGSTWSREEAENTLEQAISFLKS